MKKLFNKIKLKIINNNNKNYLKHRQIISKILSLLNFHSKNYQIIAKVMNQKKFHFNLIMILSINIKNINEITYIYF